MGHLFLVVSKKSSEWNNVKGEKIGIKGQGDSGTAEQFHFYCCCCCNLQRVIFKMSNSLV